MNDKAWVPRVLDYVAGAQVLSRTDLSCNLALATIILHDSLEIAIRCWLRYDQRVSLQDLEGQAYSKFGNLLATLRQQCPQLSPYVMGNLKCLQDRRNALTHDIRGASISNREFAIVQSSVFSALEALIGTPIAVDLLVPPITASASVPKGGEAAQYSTSGQLRDGLRLFYSGKTTDAQQIAMSVVSKDPQNSTARHLHGLCLKRQDKPEEAFAALDSAGKCPGGEDDMWLMLDIADAALAIGKIDRAEAASLRSLRLRAVASDRSRAYAILGDCNISKHDFALAERYFREALNHDHTHQRRLRGLFKALQSQHKFDDVIKLASQAIKTGPRNGHYYLDRGLALWKRNQTGDRNSARQDLKIANTCFHNRNAQTRLYFSWFRVDEFLELETQENLGPAREKLESAVTFLKEGITISAPSFRPVLRNQLSLVYMYLGNSELAVKETTDGLRENPKFVTNYLAHARALIFAGKFTDAYRAGLDSETHAPMPAGQFWGKFLAALSDALAGTNLIDWSKERQELIDLSLRAKVNNDSYQFGPMFRKISELTLTDAARSRIMELMRIANITDVALTRGAAA